MITRLLRIAAVAVLLLPPAAGPAAAQGQDWMLGPFGKPQGLGPILVPDSAPTFRSPMGDSTVHWEANATFNPAAVVKNGRVYVLYRAEDATGEVQIGGHTSRIGIAVSGDGLHFTRRPAPVLSTVYTSNAPRRSELKLISPVAADQRGPSSRHGP